MLPKKKYHRNFIPFRRRNISYWLPQQHRTFPGHTQTTVFDKAYTTLYHQFRGMPGNNMSHRQSNFAIVCEQGDPGINAYNSCTKPSAIASRNSNRSCAAFRERLFRPTAVVQEEPEEAFSLGGSSPRAVMGRGNIFNAVAGSHRSSGGEHEDYDTTRGCQLARSPIARVFVLCWNSALKIWKGCLSVWPKDCCGISSVLCEAPLVRGSE